jgi:hypothetical protein
MKYKMLVILLWMLFGQEVHAIIPGIFYPAKRFILLEDASYRLMPEPADRRIAAGGQFPQGLWFWKRQPGNSFEIFFESSIFMKGLHDQLHIKEITLHWPKGQHTLLENVTYQLPQGTWTQYPAATATVRGNAGITNGVWYWIYSGNLIDREQMSFNPERVFKGYKVGDRFELTIHVRLQFDDDYQQDYKLVYTVEVRKGEWVSPFA